MNSRLDPELLDLVRAADPMRASRVQAGGGLDAEAALRLLVLELDRQPAVRTQRRRRSAFRVAVLAVIAVAVVFVVINVASAGNGSAVPSAQAQTILRHVRDALLFPPHSIYEEDAASTVTARDGATYESGSHEWLSTSPPYNNRLIEISNGEVQWEQAFLNGRLDLYDRRTNTIYVAPQVTDNGVVGCRACSSDSPQSTSALSEVASLLDQPNVTIRANAVLDHKPAIELTFDRGRFSYWISPSTYQPLQSEDRQDLLPDGRAGVGITRYPVARVLPRSASPGLLSLQAQHPRASIDHSSTDYTAAYKRLINPNGRP